MCASEDDKIRTEKQLEQGKKWVEDKLRELAQEYKVPIKQLEWRLDIDYQLRLSLEISTDDKPQIEKFYELDLTDCTVDDKVKARLEKKLVIIVESLIPSQ